jgi:hypothetical protein
MDIEQAATIQGDQAAAKLGRARASDGDVLAVVVGVSEDEPTGLVAGWFGGKGPALNKTGGPLVTVIDNRYAIIHDMASP